MTADHVEEWPPVGSTFVSERPTDFFDFKALEDPEAKAVASLAACKTKITKQLPAPDAQLVMASLKASDLLWEYVRLHNLGVATGEFGELAQILHKDVEIVFVGAVALTLTGRDEALAAFRERPPSDTFVIKRVSVRRGGMASALYA